MVQVHEINPGLRIYDLTHVWYSDDAYKLFKEASRDDLAVVLSLLLSTLRSPGSLPVHIHVFKDATLVIIADPHDFGCDYHMLLVSHADDFIGYRLVTIE